MSVIKTPLELVANKPIAVIADVHESLKALKALISKLPQNAILLFVGDIIDKGFNTVETLAYIKQLEAEREVYFLTGNHEKYVARRVTKEIVETPGVESFVFTATALALEDSSVGADIVALYRKSYSQAIIKRYGQPIAYVTHAPCESHYLGKETKEAIYAHNNYRFKNRDSDADMVEELSFIFDQANDKDPLHIFGHVPVANGPVIYKNKVFLDTGAFIGGGLSAYLFGDMHIDSIVSVESDCLFEGSSLLDISSKCK